MAPANGSPGLRGRRLKRTLSSPVKSSSRGKPMPENDSQRVDFGHMSHRQLCKPYRPSLKIAGGGRWQRCVTTCTWEARSGLLHGSLAKRRTVP
ncbi:hypothetical protein KC333_g137 [Hortaea werneckii]|nr:hypothetical protein KC333_g137 [Hortaea werneckii]